MAKTYTYDDFRRRVTESGLDGQFSDADLALAQRNPDAGMSLLNYKIDYANATTPEMRALANQGAESLRTEYGGYTGGTDGSSFYLSPMSPGQFSYQDAPTFTDNWADRIESAYQATQNREPYSYAGTAPVYESRYDPQIQNTIAGILDRGEFSYDPKTDPVYSSYQKQYTREGQRATADALGQAAAATGGMPSSYAVTAATQAGDYYASQMADKIPELYRDAYNRYLQEYQMKLSDLTALRGLESDDYSKYRDQLSQFNADRNFDYAAWLDQQQLTQQDLQNLRALRSDDLDLYKTNLGQYNTNRSFDYGQWLDEITHQRTARQDEQDRAEAAARYGDFSFLQGMGVDTSSAEFQQNLAIAQERAKVGDYSGYAALGIDASTAQLMEALDRQAKEAQIANIYANMPTEEDRALERAYQQARIASQYAGIPTEEDRALERALQQARIASQYAGIPTEEERELQNELVRAQIAKQLSGNNGSDNSIDDALNIAKALANAGDPSMLYSIAEQYGGVNYNNIDQYNASQMKLTGLDDLNELFDDIRQMKAQGFASVQSQDQVKAMVQGLTGYKNKTMDEPLKDFLAELFGKQSNQTQKRVTTQQGLKISAN